MKKTLAILLALLAAASITLASCQDEGRTSLDDGFDDGDNEYVDTDNDETDDETNGETNNENNDGENNNNQNTNSTGWEEKNDTVYAGVDDLNLRKEQSATSTVLKRVSAGTKLNRIATNGKWDRVTLEGGTTEYYVLHQFVSDTYDNFDFTDCETPVTLTLNNDKILRLYTTPFEVYDGNTLLYNNIHKSDRVTAISGEIKKIATSKNDWLKVTIKGTVTYAGGTSETFETETEFYLSPYAVANGRVTDPDRPNGGNSSGGNG